MFQESPSLDAIVNRAHELLAAAVASSAVAVDGVEVFLGQAAAQARWFTGREVSADALRPLLS